MGVGPIPWTAIDSYAKRAGISDPDDFAEFAQVIGAVDAFYLEEVTERQKKNAQKPKSVEKPQRRR
jgi:hypothetical protein